MRAGACRRFRRRWDARAWRFPCWKTAGGAATGPKAHPKSRRQGRIRRKRFEAAGAQAARRRCCRTGSPLSGEKQKEPPATGRTVPAHMPPGLNGASASCGPSSRGVDKRGVVRFCTTLSLLPCGARYRRMRGAVGGEGERNPPYFAKKPKVEPRKLRYKNKQVRFTRRTGGFDRWFVDCISPGPAC